MIKPSALTETATAADFARNVSIEDINTVVRTLARRPAGREAIMNSPTVVRALTSNRRKGQRTCSERRDKQFSKLAKQTSQAKSIATRTANKLRRVEGTNKGLRTTLKKVRPRFIRTCIVLHDSDSRTSCSCIR